jgi:hypothetical protein
MLAGYSGSKTIPNVIATECSPHVSAIMWPNNARQCRTKGSWQVFSWVVGGLGAAFLSRNRALRFPVSS